MVSNKCVHLYIIKNNNDMTTIERIHNHMEYINAKILAGGIPTANEQEVIKIWTQLTGKKSGRAGKRIDQCAPKKARNV